MSSDYIYISAAPEDLDKAETIRSRLREIGCDARQNPCTFGDDAWAETTQTLIEGCRVFLPVVTPAYIESLPCRREVNLADACRKTMMTVFWEETPLKYGMALQLSTEQGIEKYKHQTDEGFFSALVRADCLDALRGVAQDAVSVGYFARCVLFAVTCGYVSAERLTERCNAAGKG